MSGGARGPAGQASPPPPWLQHSGLPLLHMAEHSTLVRIHGRGRPPVFFSPGAAQGPIGRFDSGSGLFGVLYMAFSFEGAFVETILRQPERRLISLAEIASREVVVLALSRAVRLVKMHGEGLQELGVDNAITTGPYEPCGLWADALYRHPDKPDGIAYASRHDPEQICVALFERPDIGLSIASDSRPLTDMSADVAALLRRYGKGLA